MTQRFRNPGCGPREVGRDLEEEHGAERLRAVVRDLIAGTRDWQDAVRTHTGEDAESFVGKARSHARGTVRAIEGGVREELLPWISRARNAAGDTARLPPQPTELRIIRIVRIARIVQRQKV